MCTRFCQILSFFSAGSTGSNTPIAASPSPSLTPAPLVPSTPKNEPGILKPRKSPKSLEAVVGKLHSKSSPSVSAPVNPYAKSDLYDDEAESPVVSDSSVKNEPNSKPEMSVKLEVSSYIRMGFYHRLSSFLTSLFKK